jgi:hypothetical protein
LAHFGATMAKFLVAPREGHLTAVVCGFAYVKKHLQSRIIIDPRPQNFDDFEWKTKNCERFYLDLHGETLPPNMPEARGKPLTVTSSMFCDTYHATDLVTRRSTTGIICFLNGTPITWYSKHQNTIERSTLVLSLLH